MKVALLYMVLCLYCITSCNLGDFYFTFYIVFGNGVVYGVKLSVLLFFVAIKVISFEFFK